MRSLKHSVYHKALRTSAVLVATILAFESGAVIPETALLSHITLGQLANVVGMHASVPTNEINTLALELQRRSTELDTREREINAQARDTAITSHPYVTYILAAILSGQLVLIILNYVFDYLRARGEIQSAYPTRRKQHLAYK